jgi:hypothetical protein
VDWSITAGTPGTHIIKETDLSKVYAQRNGDLYAARLVGNGVLDVGLYQDLDQENSLVKADTNYAFQLWVLSGNTNHATTGLRIALTDGSGTIVNDNAGNAQSTTIAAGTLNTYTSYTRVAGVLRTPRNLPQILRLVISTPSGSVLESGKILYIDYVTFAEMERVYNGGPFIKVISGDTPFALRDAFIDTISQSAGATTFVRNLDRYFGLADNDIRLVTAASFTIPDSMIS